MRVTTDGKDQIFPINQKLEKVIIKEKKGLFTSSYHVVIFFLNVIEPIVIKASFKNDKKEAAKTLSSLRKMIDEIVKAQGDSKAVEVKEEALV